MLNLGKIIFQQCHQFFLAVQMDPFFEGLLVRNWKIFCLIGENADRLCRSIFP